MKKSLYHYVLLLKRPRIFIFLGMAIIVAVLIGIVRNGQGADSANLVTVTPQEFVQEVSVTGKVVSAQDVELGFETSGRVAQVSVKVGDKVSAGQTVSYTANGDYTASVAQRQAIVASEQARLDELQRGSRPEDISLAQADVDSSMVSIEQAKRTVVDEIKDAYVKADDAVRNKVDQLYTNPRSATPDIIAFNTNSTPSNFRTTVNDGRLRAGETLILWSNSLQKLSVATYSRASLDEARTNISQMRAFLNDISIVVSALEANASLTQTTIDKYRSDISQARTNISAAAAGLSTAEQRLASAESELKKAQEQLSLKKAGSTAEQIAAQAAQVQSAQAQLQSARASYAKTVIVAPFDGIVTKVETKPGEIASPNTPVISLMSAANYEIESYISETDIAKVKVSQKTAITLDAYGKNVVFDAIVTAVDPAETVIDGVSAYKATFQFSQNDERIKSGMTANIVIETDRRQGVLIIPQQAIQIKDGGKTVTRIVEGKEQLQTVTTGSINNKGEIEVISGLSAGDQIIVSTK